MGSQKGVKCKRKDSGHKESRSKFFWLANNETHEDIQDEQRTAGNAVFSRGVSQELVLFVTTSALGRRGRIRLGNVDYEHGQECRPLDVVDGELDLTMTLRSHRTRRSYVRSSH